MSTQAKEGGELLNENVSTGLNAKDITEIILRAVAVISLLFLFLVGVKVLGGSIKLMGKDFATSLLGLQSNPFLALMAGMLSTALFQSSSVTTSIIVGMVSAGSLTVTGAVPMIMGANIGTSVTNTLVSLGYVQDKKNFERAFSAATVHDMFNLLSVIVFLPLEMATGFLGKSATFAATFLYGSASGGKFSSPIKAALKPASKAVSHFVTGTLGFESVAAGITQMIIAAIIIIFALSFIVKLMKVIVESNKGEVINRMLTKNASLGILIGAAVTVSVQSSSITTSLLVPMAGAGLLTVNSILPVTVGANIGTTATALIAALAGNVHGLAIALVHFFFNICGMLAWFVHPKMRRAPIVLCESLAAGVAKNKILAPVYIGFVFFLAPLAMIFMYK
ncbi:MAG: Na/Pi symporter [Bacteriovoracaceae bacterium]|nr:Na/Pi symporter [Bacteriovoracaceae bacterium]